MSGTRQRSSVEAAGSRHSRTCTHSDSSRRDLSSFRMRNDRRQERAPNSCTGAAGTDAGVHVTDLSIDATSATGPRCVSLSGLTIDLKLVI